MMKKNKDKGHIKILAIETSTNACSAALLLNDEIIEHYELAPQQHAQLILPMIQDLLTTTSVKLSQLDAISFGCGPGSFTGLRIAASVAQGLAFGADLPVIAISTLQALAQGAFADFGATQVLAMLDARMHEIYFGMYSLVGEIMQKNVEDTLCDPKNIRIPNDKNWFCMGDALSTYKEILEHRLNDKISKIKADYFPRARDVAKLAQTAFLTGNVTSAEKAVPVYLRNQITNLTS